MISYQQSQASQPQDQTQGSPPQYPSQPSQPYQSHAPQPQYKSEAEIEALQLHTKSGNSTARRIRFVVYIALAVTTALLLALCCISTYSTLSQLGVYEPVIIELLATCALTLALVVLMIVVIRKKISQDVIGRAWFEVTCLAILWMLWIGGAGAFSPIGGIIIWDMYGDTWFYNYLFQVIKAFAWIGWLHVSILLIGSLVFAFKRGGWQAESHSSWGAEKQV